MHLRFYALAALILLSACDDTGFRQKQALDSLPAGFPYPLENDPNLVALPEIGAGLIAESQTKSKLPATELTIQISGSDATSKLKRDPSIASLVIGQVQNRVLSQEILPVFDAKPTPPSFATPSHAMDQATFDTSVTGFSMGKELEPLL